MAHLLEVKDLVTTFRSDGKEFNAIEGVSLHVDRGEIVGIVGESGSGKSVTMLSVLQLISSPGRVAGGDVRLEGVDNNLLSYDAESEMMRQVRGGRISMIFQEPMTSLNPVLRVGEQVAEPLRLHLDMGRAEARREAERLFADVGIPSPHSRYDDYPHQLSGGMRQRVMIAMALACRPELLLADEPTTALDATIQGQILRLILDQSRERGMAVLLITHDLGVVAEVADVVGVMYAGRLVERAPARELFADPRHPYTRGLMHSAPSRRSMGLSRLPTIPGSVPSLQNMPPGCPFQPRCPEAMPHCTEAMPPSFVRGEHAVACWLAESSAP